MGKKSRANQSAPKQQQEQNQHQNKQEDQKFSLYIFLQVQKSATPDEIKKQYRKLVLKYHPDKNKQDPEARQKFQKLKQAYDILSDTQKRKIYDQTGSTGQDNFDQNAFQSAYEYFRTIYKKVTKQDIVQFQKKYRYGPMQQQDLLSYYSQYQGNMIQLIQSIPLSLNSDIPRFIKFYEDKIKNKQIQRYKSFDKTKNKVRLLKDQSQELQKEKQQSAAQLILAIRDKNKKNQNDFLAALQQKYAPKKTYANKKDNFKKEKQIMIAKNKLKGKK